MAGRPKSALQENYRRNTHTAIRKWRNLRIDQAMLTISDCLSETADFGECSFPEFLSPIDGDSSFDGITEDVATSFCVADKLALGGIGIIVFRYQMGWNETGEPCYHSRSHVLAARYDAYDSSLLPEGVAILLNSFVKQ